MVAKVVCYKPFTILSPIGLLLTFIPLRFYATGIFFNCYEWKIKRLILLNLP